MPKLSDVLKLTIPEAQKVTDALMKDPVRQERLLDEQKTDTRSAYEHGCETIADAHRDLAEAVRSLTPSENGQRHAVASAASALEATQTAHTAHTGDTRVDRELVQRSG